MGFWGNLLGLGAKGGAKTAGDLLKQVAADKYEQAMSPVKGFGNAMYGLTGKEGVMDATHNLADATSFRSGGKLPAPETPEMGRGEALAKGIKAMSAVSKNRGREIREKQQRDLENQEAKRRATLRNFYPDLF
jgi:hypothetical protein